MIMRKITTLVAISACLVLFSSFTRVEKPNDIIETTIISEDIDRVVEREMLNSIEYIEVEDEVDLGFDSYFYLPSKFNAFEGMEFEISEIEFIEDDEFYLDF